MITLRSKQTGDTIVEVLIALLVVSVILAGAYVASNRSLNTSRASQERGEALKLVEGQLERLKVASINSGSAIFTTTKLFCMDSSNNPIDNVPNFASLPTLTADLLATPTNYAVACEGIQSGSGVKYYLSIQRDASVNNQFIAFARWERVGGGTRNEVKIVYKVLQ